MSSAGPVIGILAAGRGSRLGALTASLPKSLLEVDGITILDRQLHALASAGLPDAAVRIVSGHAADALRAHLAARTPGPELVHNPDWAAYNNLASVLRLAPVAPDDLLLVNGDTLFAPGIVAALLDAPGEALLAVDTDATLAEEQMKVQLVGGRLARIAKSLDPAAAHGESIGLARFRGAALAAFYAELARLLAEGCGHEWYEGALDRLADRVPLGVVPTRGLPWIEVDTPEDLDAARRLASALAPGG